MTESKNRLVDVVTVTTSAREKSMLGIRLLVAGLANLCSFNSEEIEDLKVAISEACTCAPEGSNSLKLTFFLEGDKLVVEVGPSLLRRSVMDLGNAAQEGIGFLLMQNLMDSMEYKTGEKGTFIRLVKNQKNQVQRQPS